MKQEVVERHIEDMVKFRRELTPNEAAMFKLQLRDLVRKQRQVVRDEIYEDMSHARLAMEFGPTK